MNSLMAIDVKAFVPAKNFTLALDFYQEAVWILKCKEDSIAELESGSSRFLL